MERQLLKYFWLVFFVLVSAGRLSAQIMPSSMATCQIYAGIITIYSAGEKTEMNFGKFSPGPQGGKIILSPENTILIQGGGFKGSGTHNAASFYLSGNDDVSYSITLPKTPVVLTHASKAKTMVVEGWVSTPFPAIGTTRLQDGSQLVFVGATLKVGTIKDNPLGFYTGSYAITFDFN